MTATRRILAALAVGWLLALLTPATAAQAHATLASSDPQSGAVLPQAPATVTLTFTESVQAITDRIRVLDPDNARVDKGQPTVSGSTVSITVDAGKQGTYLVSYRVVSADSHPVAGAFTFSVGAPSQRSATDDEAPAQASTAVRTALPIVRWAGYVGLLLTVGAVLVLTMLWPHRLSRAGPARLAYTGFGLITASTLAGLWLQVPYTTGGGLLDAGPGELADLIGTKFGTVLLIRLVVVAVAVVLARPLLSGTGDSQRLHRDVLAVLSLVGLATWSLSGHPAASPVPTVSVIIDTLHLGAMAVWLGGLVMLLALLLPRASDSERQAILPIWGRWAAAAVAALAFTGIVQALIEIGTFSALITSTYGRLLLAKLALVALALGAAALARRHLSRTGGTGTLRRLIATEVVITAVVLAVTSVLVQTPPARVPPAAPATGETGQQVQTLRHRTFSLQVTVFPAQTGNNTLHLYAYAPDGKPLPVVEWTATAALPEAGIEPIEIPLLRITDNHAIGDIALPSVGQWQFKFTLRTSDIDQGTVTATFPIS
ncbi:copper resistance CopC/CopD family protein [Actinoplanes flavus]|uniref:copper resistance CopC/CopD family protein n=1 Tax=Actinoplanes flavus TaxID=2820290 RepID=UPI0027DDAC49|nr:copper resistance protein CopC [Actinoplanes flavus]